MSIILPSKLNPKALLGHGFTPEDFDEFVSNDRPVATHRGYTISLMIPNGGILGVSFYKSATGECYSRPTEGCDDFPGYQNGRGHIEMAIAAIDAATPEPIGEQMEIFL